jgi:hypothetical protein
MPMYAFPVSSEMFRRAIKAEEIKSLAKALGVDEPGAFDFVYGCLRQGWMNKQYHKNKQQNDQQQLREIKKRLEADPELRRRVLGDMKTKGV